jgi:hypothetical protein
MHGLKNAPKKFNIMLLQTNYAESTDGKKADFGGGCFPNRNGYANVEIVVCNPA